MSGRWFLQSLFGSFLCLWLVGCGSDKTPTFNYVTGEGVVLIDGKPAEKISVWFLPDSLKGNKGPRSTAITDAEGKFTLTSDVGTTGVVSGWHMVVLDDLAADRPRQGEASKNPPRIPPDSSSIRDSSIFIKVPTDGDKTIRIELTAPKVTEEKDAEPMVEKKAEPTPKTEEKKVEAKPVEPKVEPKSVPEKK